MRLTRCRPPGSFAIHRGERGDVRGFAPVWGFFRARPSGGVRIIPVCSCVPAVPTGDKIPVHGPTSAARRG